MEFSFSKLSASIFLAVAGLGFLIFGLVGDQNAWFNMAAGAILIGGIAGTLGALNIFHGNLKYAIAGVLVIIWVGLASLDFKSIKDPIDFRDAKRKRFDQTIQKLKDLRQVQLTFKSQKNVYASDAKTLLDFIKYDSVQVVKAIGFVPDTLSEEEALEMGIISRDTIYEPAAKSVFNDSYLKERDNKYKLDLDELTTIPFSNGKEFTFEAGQIERNSLMVNVFKITAPREDVLLGLNKRLIKLEKDLTVGSMTDPTTSGNWGE